MSRNSYLSIAGLLHETLARSLRFPVATVTAITLTAICSQIIAVLPSEEVWQWFVRSFVSATCGFSLIFFLLFLSSAKARHQKVSYDSLVALAVSGALVGLVISLPTFLVNVLPGTWIPHSPHFMHRWVDVSVISIGCVLPIAAWPVLPVAWVKSLRHDVQFHITFRGSLADLENAGLSRRSWTVFIGTAGCILAVVPWLALAVIPLLMHLVVVVSDHLPSPK